MVVRNKSLDVLRGAAILLVLLFHFPYFNLFGRIGWCGVDLFFVLSGYLISGLLFREYQQTGGLNIRRFILRRGFKIWPSLYAYLGICAVVLCFTSESKYLDYIFFSGIFLTSYFRHILGLVGHTWSLAVEEHFYLALPFLLFLMVRWRRIRAVPVLCLFVIGAAMVARFFQADELADTATHCRMDGLFIGVTLGYLNAFEQKWFASLGRHWSIPVAAALLVAGFTGTGTYARVFGHLYLALGFALILAWSVQRNAARLFAPLATLGTYSYCVYLWQQPFTVASMNWRPLPFWGFAMLFVLAVSAGVLMSELVEIPMLRIRERFMPESRHGESATKSSMTTAANGEAVSATFSLLQS